MLPFLSQKVKKENPTKQHLIKSILETNSMYVNGWWFQDKNHVILWWIYNLYSITNKWMYVEHIFVQLKRSGALIKNLSPYRKIQNDTLDRTCFCISLMASEFRHAFQNVVWRINYKRGLKKIGFIYV